LDNLKVTDRLPDGVYVAFYWYRLESIGVMVGGRGKNLRLPNGGEWG